MSEVRSLPCPSVGQEACKYFYTPDGCHVSLHHEFPRRTMDTAMKRRFGNLAINQVLSCRNIHDLLDRMPDPQYPPEEEMDRIIMRERDAATTKP